MSFTTRFAPSPTGPLHLGHAYSALLAHDMARAAGGCFLLRIEDIDRSRARDHWEEQIYDDLSWLGISWERPVMRQSDRLKIYAEALDFLWEQKFLYPCACTRRDIEAALSAPQEGVPRFGPDGVIYPGTCRGTRREGSRPENDVLRLDCTGIEERHYNFKEDGQDAGVKEFSKLDIEREVGDIVLARREMGTSYHLSVVLDDAALGITHVVRGADLFEATKIHVVLQNLLHLPTPTYHHHRLIRDENGKRLAKRDDARAIAKYRADGASPQDIRQMVGLPVT